MGVSSLSSTILLQFATHSSAISSTKRSLSWCFVHIHAVLRGMVLQYCLAVISKDVVHNAFHDNRNERSQFHKVSINFSPTTFLSVYLKSDHPNKSRNTFFLMLYFTLNRNV